MRKIIYNIVSFLLIVLLVSCEKQEPIVEEPKIIPLSSCGPLEYYHSMFVINNECWGENPPREGGLYKYNSLIFINFRRKNNFYDTELYISEDQNYLNKKRFILAYGISVGDGHLSSYSYTFNIDSTKNIQLKFNQDSTEVEGKIINLSINAFVKRDLPDIPDKIVIYEGSFRVRLEK
ncbi:MAG TPA: hypothetical protein PKD85_18275 [Saprospiraceae bacterium]|nr:hypothetical protein [Saprospiraceae bacterium]